MAIIHRFQGEANGEFRWQDVPLNAYGPANSRAVGATRQLLLGPGASEHFHLRYFAVQPGGHTSLDQHAHEHGVYLLHGQALLRLGDEEHILNAGDVVYIAGNEVHQFFARAEEPFGFLCIVPAKR